MGSHSGRHDWSYLAAAAATTGLSGNIPSLLVLCWPCTYATATLRSHKILAVNRFLAFVLFFTIWFLARKFSLTRTKLLLFFFYLLNLRKVKWKSLSCVWLLPPHGLYSLWNSPGQNNTGVGSLSLLQGSSQPMGRTQVSGIAVGFFISWATRSIRGTWQIYISFTERRDMIYKDFFSQSLNRGWYLGQDES